MNDTPFLNENEMRAVLMDRLAGKTQLALAQELGVSPPYLNDIVHGRRRISKRIAKKLGYRIDAERIVVRRYFAI